MATSIRTVNYLPEIFQTVTNKQFLSATLDQLVQEPQLKTRQGYIGRRYGPGVSASDSYVLEPTNVRSQYQLEPGIVFLETNANKVKDVLTYPGLIDSIKVGGGIANRHDRLFDSEYYSWDPFIDLDKFVNFGQYYWLPNGPDAVVVAESGVPIRDDFVVTRDPHEYTFGHAPGKNPVITLVRGGSYTFDLSQTGNPFWIQSAPGVSGTLTQAPNLSSRDVLGVTNNGASLGTVKFNVPLKSAQSFYYDLDTTDNVDLVTNLQFDQINNIFVSELMAQNKNGIDGIKDLDGKSLVFLSDAGWFYSGQYDSAANAFDTSNFDETTEITLNSDKYSVWRINYVYDEHGQNPYVKLTIDRSIPKYNKFRILYGDYYSNRSFYKNASEKLEEIPHLTAAVDTLYYQDQNNPELFGIIRLVNEAGAQTLDITDILGKKTYTSPNGVTFTNGLKVKFEGLIIPSSYQSKEYYVQGVGTSIQLIDADLLFTPETYTQSATTPFDTTLYDSTSFDNTLNAPLTPDYMVIDRSSPDYNPWSRCNRWFHKDVIIASAKYNGVAAVFNNDNRGKRPIIEFRPGLKLFNFGTEAIPPVNIIDFAQTDAFSNVNGSSGYSVDGYPLTNGSRVIFANDRDRDVKDKIYTVSLIDIHNNGNYVIDLQPEDITAEAVLRNQSVVCLSGVNKGGLSYYFDGTSWVPAQQKTKVNQAPLFDIFDANGFSFSDTTVYPSSTFAGNKVFSYAIGSGTVDSIIRQPIKYKTINNVGDIVFDNNIYTDSFIYVSNSASVTVPTNVGFAYQYLDRTNYQQLVGWQKSFSTQVSRQIFSFTYSGQDLVLDIPVTTDDVTIIPLKVFVNSEFVSPADYTYTINANGSTVIRFVKAPVTGAIVEVSASSKVASKTGYYSVPSNLDKNPLGDNIVETTLGTIRNHYGTICQNITDFAGTVNGANNIRDLGNVIPYGDAILQHSASLALTGLFINNREYDYFKALEYSSSSYEKYKNLLLDTMGRNDFQNKTIAEILDECITIINLGKSQLTPFYWTDTLPTGSGYQETVYTVTPITNNIFATLNSHDFTTANYTAILVYLNGNILTGNGHDYTVATDGPRITINVPLAIGDVITVREYTNTYGNYVPATPTKLGLYPAFKPEIFVDDTYITPTHVIRGHDGSITPLFGDLRDNVLLEFETRIYNNLKLQNNNVPLLLTEVLPGQFRTTDYNLGEVTQILSSSLLTWVGSNNLDYKSQDFNNNNPFTWNYSSSANILTGETLPGSWRGAYFYLYDTDAPHVRPWEMLGFAEKPTWWENEYGPAPYTSGNLVLWQDLEAGTVKDPAGNYTLAQFARPGLTDIIPTDSEGNLLPPSLVAMGEYEQSNFRKSWTVGDYGPVESAWRRSSAWPFAVQRLLALTKPAKYFALFADRDQYRYSDVLGQVVYNSRFRSPPTGVVEVYGDGTAKHSYVNWVVDYNRQSGLDSTYDLTQALVNQDIRLCYRMAGFTDKRYFKIYAEKSNPNSTNSSLMLPEESYQLVLYKNPTFGTLAYSSVIVQKTDRGYSVFGYSTTKPYFEILSSIPNGNYQTITVNGVSVRASQDYSNNIVQVPYGYEFTSISTVVDFLLSYGELLASRGMSFDTVDNNRLMNWNQIAQEFMYWTQQGWATGSIINLNPAANVLSITKPGQVAEALNAEGIVDVMLDQNKQKLNSKDYVVERIDNTITLRGLNNKTFNYLDAKFTAYEHILVFDNTSVFNDLIYDPTSGTRQNRLTFNGKVSVGWNGTLNAPGFILNQDNIQEWTPNTGYSKGEIVLYKGSYWSAGGILPPSNTFDFNSWLKSDYALIDKGMLPNLAAKAEQNRNFYDTKAANLDSDGDLMSFGLTGFRPRAYMQNLNLDDVSQVNIYNQFIGVKGTTQATDIFTNAYLGKELANYKIQENWAIQRATYGAKSNRSYFELQLDQSKLLSNPATVSIINPQEDSTADQTFLLKDLWKQSYKITSTSILPTTTIVDNSTTLPSAGYVNVEDVDVQVFDFVNLKKQLSSIDNIQTGTSIWVAKDNNHDWNIYRTNLVRPNVITARDNLNGTSLITFNGYHSLKTGDTIIIKNFNSQVDGVYSINSVPSLKSLTINLALPGTTTNITGVGVCFVLASMRVKQPSDINTLGYAGEILPGNSAWVDNDGTGNWAVYKKINPFGSAIELAPAAPLDNGNFGSAVAQSGNNLFSLIGVPNRESGIGGVYDFVRTDQDTYAESVLITLNAVNVAKFGNAVDIGYHTWAVAGASASNNSQGYVAVLYRNPVTGNLNVSQILVQQAGDELGYSVCITPDERWLYVGAPGNDKVYVYNAVNVESQFKNFIGDGKTSSFEITDAIIVSPITSTAVTQINVLVNNIPKTAGVDFLFNGNSIVFVTAPNNGDKIKISRRTGQTYFPSVPTTDFNLTSIYTATNINSFTVLLNEVIQRPGIDYTYNPVTKHLTFMSGVTGTVSINSGPYFEYVTSITGTAGTRFGHAITTTTDGRQVIISAPYATANGEINAGQVYVYDRSVEKFTVTNPNTKTYTGLRTPQGLITVKVNSKFLTPTLSNNDGEYTISGNSVTVNNSLLVGDIIEIENNNFKLVQTIESVNPQANNHFGAAIDQCPTNCSLYIGSPYDSTLELQAGSVDRWANQNRLYGILSATVADPLLTPGDTIRINNVDVMATGYTIAEFANDINNANIPNVTAVVADQILTISIVNSNAAVAYSQLVVLPGLGTAFYDLGLMPLAWTQTINPPVPSPYTQFGASLNVSTDAMTLVVGAPRGTALVPVTFDNATTLFDSRATSFIDNASQSGVVYTYDYLPAVNGSIHNPGKFVFGQQIFDQGLQANDGFGSAVSYVSNKLLVGSPYNNLSGNSGNYGRVSFINNVKHSGSWVQIHNQQPIVDVNLINGVFVYNRNTSEVLEYLDYIDPIQGKILGPARQNIDFIAGIDPAAYNHGSVNNYGEAWTDNHVGKIWWNTSNLRYIDYHQSTIQYASQRWSQLFTGSSVDVYQWIESDVPPADYTGEGTPFNTTSYVVRSHINNTGLFVPRYFFWVKNITSVATSQQKTLSIQAITQYIENPASSGIPYVAFTAPNTIALYNVRPLLNAQDVIINVEYDQQANDDNVHVEYDLIVSGNSESFLGANLYRKMLDSFVGADTVGNTVPDNKLGIADLYGVNFRPRQSMFVDRFIALKNYMIRANSILAQYPITESRVLNLLKSSESEPTAPSGAWDKRLLTFAELTYQDLSKVLPGYRYLIASDDTNQGLWTIYTVQANKSLMLTRVQNFDTTQFWSYVNWVGSNYNPSVKPVTEVPTYSGLSALTVDVGASVKVTKNSNGKYEIYQWNGSTWNRVVLQDGTIAINVDVWDYSAGRFGFDAEVFDAQRFVQAPITETRQILRSINEEIFTGDLLIHRNELLMLVFEYIMSEQQAPGWLFKTSLIDIDHKIRDLLPYPIYRRDNQTFVEDYINEVKPYHVRIKQFNLRYTGAELFDGTLTDFDVPAYYNGSYVSPILDNSMPPLDQVSSKPSYDPLWTQLPYNQWYNNYKLKLQGVELLNAGEGYTVPPQVEIFGDAEVPAVLTALVDTSGKITAINIDYAGSGYLTTPTIYISGGNGTGGKAVAILGNSLVREFKTTIKYDRLSYTSQVTDWTANNDYTAGALIRFNNAVYSVNNNVNSGESFDPAYYTVVDQSTLSGVDRIIGLYTPTASEPGRTLARVISGIDYPGVQVHGPDFSQNSGLDVGNYDVNPFDNIDIGPEGLPTYDPGILDTIYESSFVDSYLGTRPTDINVDGGKFIDTYSSHAPEELVPGSIFDSLDMRIYTRPGSDWSGQGYGFDIQSVNGIYQSGSAEISFAKTVKNISAVRAVNTNTGRSLLPMTEYTVNWPAQTLTVFAGATEGDIIDIQVYGIGGGNQLFKQTYPGNKVGNFLVVPVNYSEIADIDVFVNGVLVHENSFVALDHSTQINFTNTYDETHSVVVVVLGFNDVEKDISYPITDYFTLSSATPGSVYTLANTPQGSDIVNAIVERGGQRLRPPESIEYFGDNSTTNYALPTKGKIYQLYVSDNDVLVYVDNVLKRLSVDYTVSAGSSNRYITFSSPPAVGSHVVIVVTTSAEYNISGNQLTLRVGGIVGDSIAVTTWADAQEQNILTQVFVGPTIIGAVTQEAYDSTNFDPQDRRDSYNFGAGTFDYASGVLVRENELDIGRQIDNPDRLWVTKNGHRLLAGEDYTITGTKIHIGGSVLSDIDVVVITSFTQNVVPETVSFRLFQDMRGKQTLYRITDTNTTKLVQDLSIADDVIHLENVQDLSIPDPAMGILGLIIIGNERIAYRSLDPETNTVSSLRRGILGTSIVHHTVGTLVTDIGAGEALGNAYQQKSYYETFIITNWAPDTAYSYGEIVRYNNVVYKVNQNHITSGSFNSLNYNVYNDGTGTTFTTQALNDYTAGDAVRVSIAGAELSQNKFTVTANNPVTITLNSPLVNGSELRVFLIQATVMYDQGSGTASNGEPLQYQNTQAGQFIQNKV